MGTNYYEKDMDEKATAPFTTTLTSDGSTAIALASIDSIEITLINDHDGEPINSRQKQDALNTGDFTMHATSGLFTWEIQSEDTTIQDATQTPVGSREPHRATITVIWDTDKQMQIEVLLKVLNLRSVPQVSA